MFLRSVNEYRQMNFFRVIAENLHEKYGEMNLLSQSHKVAGLIIPKNAQDGSG